jgi:hypothetical protein
MLPVLTIPFALVGLLALPALVLIYWLRKSRRRLPVSSLLLWADQTEIRAGGLRIQRLQTPLLFLLEILALVLLTAAAAGPRLPIATGARPLVVVLDDSYSMLAGDSDSPRSLGLAALDEELNREMKFSVQFVLAGARPQLVGEPARSASECRAIVDGWKCRAPTARITEAIAFASGLASGKAGILVISDHAADFELEKGRTQWWAFGKPRPNIAFVNAVRDSREGQDRCLLEIANLAAIGQSTPLRITTETGDMVHTSTLELKPGEIRRLAFRLSPDTPRLEATLGEDDLEIDNRVILLADKRSPVRVELKFADERLRKLVAKALRATGKTKETSLLPDLVFTDKNTTEGASPLAWQVSLLAEPEADPFIGPFVQDRGHPLLEGIDLQGVVWGAGRTKSMQGVPLILAGSVPLVSDAETPGGTHHVRIRLRPDLSTLPDLPQWPALIWNLVQWRASHSPGLNRSNVRLGETVVLNASPGVDSIEVKTPSGESRKMPVLDKQALLRADSVGVFQVQAGDNQYPFAANALSRDESDLTGCETGKWGEWHDPAVAGGGMQNLAWILLLVTLGVLTLHLVLSGRAAG